MNAQQISTLMQRLDRLKRENRWWKTLGLMTMAALALIVLIGATQSRVAEEIRARKFVVVDKDGRVRATLGISSEGTTSLNLNDEDGRFRTGISLGPDGIAGVVMNDKEGVTRIGLAISREGIPTLALQDRDGKPRAHLYLNPEGWPGLLLRDKDSMAEARLNFKAKGRPALIFTDENGKPRTSLIASADVGSALIMLSKDGLPRASMVLSPDGNGFFRASGNEGVVGMGLNPVIGPELKLVRQPRTREFVQAMEKMIEERARKLLGEGKVEELSRFSSKFVTSSLQVWLPEPSKNVPSPYLNLKGLPSIVFEKDGKVIWSAP